MSTTPPGPTRVDVTTVDLRRSWGFVLALGSACIVAGFLTLIWPGVTILALVVVLGVFLLFAGASEIGWALAERHTDGWKVILARGIIDAITGLIVLVWPDVTVLALALILAAWLFVYAAMTLWYAWRHRGQLPHTGHFVAKGFAALIAAVITVAWPDITALVVAIVIGIELILYGVMLTRLGLELRRQRPAV
jgi:uncharacterized membrane protein HdeD (DUF308 family)